MKPKSSILLAVFAVVALCGIAFTAVDIPADTWRFRHGSTLKIAPGVTLQDEDANWIITHAEFGYLAGVTSDVQTQLAAKPNAALLAGTLTMPGALSVTQSFATAFSAAPVIVLTAGTNVLPHVVTITASNFIAGAASTGTVQWIAVKIP